LRAQFLVVSVFGIRMMFGRMSSLGGHDWLVIIRAVVLTGFLVGGTVDQL
jgi:hypothetical protein